MPKDPKGTEKLHHSKHNSELDARCMLPFPRLRIFENSKIQICVGGLFGSRDDRVSSLRMSDSKELLTSKMAEYKMRAQPVRTKKAKSKRPAALSVSAALLMSRILGEEKVGLPVYEEHFLFLARPCPNAWCNGCI